MSTPPKVRSGFNFPDREFYFHQFQEKAYEALLTPDIREVALLAGIQGGKTSFGAIAFLKQISLLSQSIPGCNFIVAADNYKTLSQATVPTLMKVISHIGTYNQGKQEFQIKRGGKIFFRTSTDPWSVEGIPDCAFAWIDEAGKCSKMFQINVLGRVARLKGKVLYTSTPYAMNWLYTDVEKPFMSGERKDIALIRFSSADNPAFPRDEYERQKQLMDPRMFRMKYMGIHERMQGLVYQLDGINLSQSFMLPKGTRFFAGVDWGFAEGHEFALVVRAITPDKFHYTIDEVKLSGLTPDQQMNLCLSKRQTYQIETFYCDPARPDMIAMLQKAGISAIGFHVGKENHKQIVPGIMAHTELMKSGRYRIFQDRCPHLIDEYETYHWPEAQEGKEVAEKPIAINDHLLDAERYVTIGTMHVKVKGEPQPFVGVKRPEQDRWSPIKKSKRAQTWEAY